MNCSVNEEIQDLGTEIRNKAARKRRKPGGKKLENAQRRKLRASCCDEEADAEITEKVPLTH
jgi:hypothetical protein